MGERKKLDFTCQYCGKRFNLQELRDSGYVVETKVGLCVTCRNVKCEAEQLIQK